METDVLIIGSGVAGSYLAVNLCKLMPTLNITLITKDELAESNTRYAQGGIAAVMNQLKDSFDEHIHDTLFCGKGLCDKEVVDMVVKEAPERIKDLLEIGVHFDLDNNNNFNLALEGGHSRPRVLHQHDQTGAEIETNLINELHRHTNIEILHHVQAIDLIIDNKETNFTCQGVYVFDELINKTYNLFASYVVLATGGCGQVFEYSTNPKIATGDGYAMANRAGATLKNMRFVQFHPTVFFDLQNKQHSFLISEALRGYGAYIVDSENKRFLFKYDSKGELANRDVVTNGIFQHLKETNQTHVFLDLRHLNSKKCAEQFPHIITNLKKSNIDYQKELIPIAPAAHYQCGGIQVNKNAETNIKRLYAIGEVSCTGLHGANRLASNSLLEAIVFANHVAHHIKNNFQLRSIDSSILNENSVSVIEKINSKEEDNISYVKKIFSNAYQCTEISKQAKTINQINEVLNYSHNNIIRGNINTHILQLRNLCETSILILKDKINNFQPAKKTKIIPSSYES